MGSKILTPLLNIMERIDILNERLKNTFGTIIDGRVKYRLSWSTTQTEVRKDSYNVFYGNIFLRREENVVKEVPKYPYDKDRWVLEYLTYDCPPNLVSAFNGSYEPIWIFRDGKGQYLHPNWAVLEFMINAFEGRVESRMTASDIDAEEAKSLAAEIAQFEEEIKENNRSDLFAFEQSAVLNKTDMWERK